MDAVMEQNKRVLVDGVEYFNGMRVGSQDEQKWKAPAIIAIFAAAPVAIGIYGLIDVLTKF